MIRATLRPVPRGRIADWVEANVYVPKGPKPGMLRLHNSPIFAGIFDLVQQRNVHFATFCTSARIGKTLISICFVLYWIAEKFGDVAWLDPSGVSAKRLVRDELDEHLLKCRPVRALAVAPPGTAGAKTAWTTLWKTFRGKVMRILASGAEADMHGFNAPMLSVNELDRCRASLDRDAASDDKLEARTILFPHTRLILRNSTPGDKGELSPIWFHFHRGSQHYPYLPCPHCTEARKAERASAAPFTPPRWPLPGEKHDEGRTVARPGWAPLSYDPDLAGWQRLSFFVEKKLVPFDTDLQPLLDEAGQLLPREQWREEATGQVDFEKFAIMASKPRADDPTQTELVRVGWRLDDVEAGATYRCAHCQKQIENIDLGWMTARFRLVSHNPFAPKDRVSFHLWSALSIFVPWGSIAKEFLECKGNLGALIKFWNLWLGLPFTRSRTAIKEDDLDRCIGRCPRRYVQGQIPLEAETLTMTVDCQGEQFWFTIRAWGLLLDAPDQPTWSALVDWGEAVSWRQILELGGLVEDSGGRLRRFKFTRADGTVREYCVTRALVDSGFEAETNKKVYEFCLENSDVFSPYKGGDQSKTRGNPVRLAPIMDDQLDLVWAWSDYFAADLYYTCIRDGVTVAGPVHWWLPSNVDRDYRSQLTNERQVEEHGRFVWTAFGDNHLGDCEKMQRVLEAAAEEDLDDARAEFRAAQEAQKPSLEVIRQRVAKLTRPAGDSDSSTASD